MKDEAKTKEQLLDELVESRRRIVELEGIDIEWRQSEEALQQSEERYRLLVEAIPDSIWRADASGKVIEFNRHWYEYTGQAPEEAKGNGWINVLHPDDVAITTQRVRAAVDAGENVQIEHRVRRASDGGYRWHLARALPMKDRDGKVTGWFGSVTDIDDQKRTEEELRTNRALLRATIDNLPFAFFVLGANGRYVMENAVMRANWGQLVGKTPEEVCPDKDTRSLWLDNNRRAFAGEQVEEDVTFTVKGEKRFYHNVIAPIIDAGKIRGILGMNVDITERKRAEEALRQSEQRYRTLAESTRDIIYIVDQEGTLLYANQTASAYTGLNTTDIVGKRQADLFPPEMAATHVARVEQVFETGEVFEEDELFHFGPEEVWLRIHLVPLRDDAGQITSVMGVCHNITDRKRAEAALKRAHDELEEEVRERTAELTTANEQLAIFRKFAEASGQGFSMADLDGRITYINPALSRILGEERPEEAIGKNLSTYFSEESNRRGEQEILPALNQQGYWEGELPMISLQGRWIPTWHHTFMIREEQGNALCIAVVITDITERKQAEEALRASEERFRSYFVQGLIGMAVTSPDKRWQEVNDRLCEILGYSRDKLIGMQWTAVTHPDDREAGRLLFDRMTTGEIDHYTREKRFIRKNGEVIFARNFIRCFRRKDGTMDHVLALIEDITARKQAEEALQQSHDELRAIHDQVVDGIIIVDAETWNPVRVNSAFCRMVGYSEEEAKTISPKRIHPPEVLPMVREHCESTQRGITARLDNLPFLRQDGGTIYADVVSRPIHYNERRCWISFFHDVTERRKAHEVLVRERRTLKHMLRASDHERQLIAYDIHDGLAQQLAGAIMQLQTYGHLKRTRPKAAAKAFDAGMTMLRQGHSEARRLVSGVRPPILDESGVVAAVAHLVNDPTFQGKPHAIFHSDVMFSRLTPILENVIYRIVQEGLTNASKHSQSEMVRVNLRQRGDKVRIEIRDWGVGFDPKTVSGDRFGLAGIRERARLLGGKCRIQSTLGEGTTILIELPVAEREEEGGS